MTQENIHSSIGLPAALIILGSITLLGTLNELKQEIFRSTWPKTEGIVTSTEINKERKTGRHSKTSMYFKADYYKKNYDDYYNFAYYNYFPQLTFKYSVHNESFIGKTEILTDQLGNGYLKESESFVKKYAPGQKVTVYYNPENPQESTLINGFFFCEMGTMYTRWMILIATIILWGSGLFLWLKNLEYFQKQTPLKSNRTSP